MWDDTELGSWSWQECGWKLLTREHQPHTSRCSQWTEFLQIHFWVTQVHKSFQNAIVKHCRVTAWPSCCLLRKQGFFSGIPCLIILWSIPITWDRISQIIRVLEVIRSHTSLSLQLELERRELMSQRSWLLLHGDGERLICGISVLDSFKYHVVWEENPGRDEELFWLVL